MKRFALRQESADKFRCTALCRLSAIGALHRMMCKSVYGDGTERNPVCLTSNHLGSLEILIRMQVARGKGEVDTNEEEEQVYQPPHR